MAPSSSLSKLSPPGLEPWRPVLPTSCVLGQYCDFHRAASLDGLARRTAQGHGAVGRQGYGEVAHCPEDDSGPKGCRRCGREPGAQHSLTSTIPTPSMKTEAVHHGAGGPGTQHVRTGIAPYRSLYAPPIQMDWLSAWQGAGLAQGHTVSLLLK